MPSDTKLNNGKAVIFVQSDIPCICDRETYAHQMNSDCAHYLRKKLKEWDKKYDQLTEHSNGSGECKK